ncbi:MAG: hypothetical protein KIT84_31080 [Labilithrix sp.]|nr:hypothetical protein [Labilithrix sp.]MCW5815513.1 hypothetical protein [Labilithrix sp.]
MEQRVAENKRAKAAPPWKQQELSYDTDDDDPTSGIRGPDARPLTYTVYSVNDLDARPRSSMPPPMPAPVPSRWPDAWRSAKAVARAWWAYYVCARPRPQMMDVCRVPLMTLRADLAAALRQLPWKKIGVRAAIAFGSILLFGFVVFTVAELTDDLKPTRSATANKLEAPPDVAPPPPETKTEPAKTEPAKNEPAPVVPQANANDKLNEKPIELDDGPPIVAKPKPPVKSRRGSKRKKGPETFVP